MHGYTIGRKVDAEKIVVILNVIFYKWWSGIVTLGQLFQTLVQQKLDMYVLKLRLPVKKTF